MAITPAMAARRFSPPESSKGDFSSKAGFRSVKDVYKRQLIHSAGCNEYFGNKNFIVFELFTHNTHAVQKLSLIHISGCETPVIFLTALGSVADKVKGLRGGAEDYIVKPFEAVELLARIEVVLRRAGKSETLSLIHI